MLHLLLAGAAVFATDHVTTRHTEFAIWELAPGPGTCYDLNPPDLQPAIKPQALLGRKLEAFWTARL